MRLLFRTSLLLCLSVLLFPFTGEGQTRASIDSANAISFVEVLESLGPMKKLYEKTLEDAEKIHYKKGKAVALSRLAIVEYYLNDYDKGMDYSMRAVQLFEEMGDMAAVAGTYADLGYSLKAINLDLALSYFRQAIEIGERHNVGIVMAKIYDNYGVLLQPNLLDSAVYFYQRALTIKEKYKDVVGIPYSLNKLATAYSAHGNFKKAFEYLDRSDEIRQKENGLHGMADNLAYRADIFYDMNKADSAIYYYEQAVTKAEKVNFQALKRFCYDRLTQLYAKKKNYERAYFYNQKLQHLNDSTFTAETSAKIANLQVEFETEKKQKEIAEQRLINARQTRISESRKKWIIFGSGLLVFLLVGIVFIYYSQRLKRQNEQKAAALQSKLEQARLEKKFAEEKLNISRELHDNIGSHLTFMISSVDNLVYQEQEPTKIDKLNSISNFGRNSMKDLRTTIWAMKHDGGTLQQLILKLTELKNALGSQLDIAIINKANPDLTLNALQMLNIHRIAQESIQNTIKYAGATGLKVLIEERGQDLKLSVSDNGKGFDTSDIGLGNGLQNMKYRAEEIGGQITFDSQPGSTVISVAVPLNAEMQGSGGEVESSQA